MTNEAEGRERVKDLIKSAVSENATDVHLECFDSYAQIRFRVDGVLRAKEMLTTQEHHDIVLQLKVMGDMDITESKRPQDARISVDIDGEPIDIRVSSAPVISGESITLRLLSQSKFISDFHELGLTDDQQRTLGDWYQKPSGLIVVTGPVGSGKTTLLYNILSVLNIEERNIFTIEDPVEMALEGISQMAVSTADGLTFGAGLRAVLRHAPNVVMIGEIRDAETASLAMNAAASGHLVLSTLHTMDATGVFGRLTDMGVAPFLLREGIIGVIATRLVRKICQNCKEEYQPEGSLVKMLDLRHDKYWRADGCDKCGGAGLNGRTAIYELFSPDDELRSKILNGCSGQALRQEAVKKGLTTLWRDGVNKCSEGMTTLPEVVRVLGAPEVI